MGKYSLLLLFVLLLSIFSLAVSAQTLYSCSGANICGDLNCDGYSDNSDSVIVIAHVRGRITLNPSLMQRADVDRNNIIDANDAIRITHFNAGLSATLNCRQGVLPAVRRSSFQGPQPIAVSSQNRGPTQAGQQGSYCSSDSQCGVNYRCANNTCMPAQQHPQQSQAIPCRDARINPISVVTALNAPAAQGNTPSAALTATMSQTLRLFNSNGVFNEFKSRLDEACRLANPGQNCAARIMGQNLIPMQCTKDNVRSQFSGFRTLSHSNYVCDTAYLYSPRYVSANNYRTPGGQIRIIQTSTTSVNCVRP